MSDDQSNRGRCGMCVVREHTAVRKKTRIENSIAYVMEECDVDMDDVDADSLEFEVHLTNA